MWLHVGSSEMILSASPHFMNFNQSCKPLPSKYDILQKPHLCATSWSNPTLWVSLRGFLRVTSWKTPSAEHHFPVLSHTLAPPTGQRTHLQTGEFASSSPLWGNLFGLSLAFSRASPGGRLWSDTLMVAAHFSGLWNKRRKHTSEWVCLNAIGSLIWKLV